MERLKDDHQRAAVLEDVLRQLPWVKNVLPAQTNIVIFEVADNLTSAVVTRTLAGEAIKAIEFDKKSVRLVTHLDFTDEMLGRCVEVLKKLKF